MSISHNNIVRCLNCFMASDNTKLCIMQEYCDRGDLKQYIQMQAYHGNVIRESKIRKVVIEILLALDCIHDMKIIHRDIKPSNIFMKGKNLDVKIGDFGVRLCYISMVLQVAKMLSSKTISHSNIGTLCYSAPEVVKNQEYDCRADVWSLGCIIYEMCN